MTVVLSPGDAAPEFALPADDGQTYSLAGLRGKRVVLYFYPKDDTPGCTTQACEFRDRVADFEAKGAVILGVSRDTLAAHGRFRTKYSLTFPLLSDPEGVVHQAYGAWGEKNMYGKKTIGPIRTTVVIDEEGRISVIQRNVKAAGNAQRTLDLLG